MGAFAAHTDTSTTPTPDTNAKPHSKEHTKKRTHPMDGLHARALEEAVVDAVEPVHVRVAGVLDGLPVEAERLRYGVGGLDDGMGKGSGGGRER